MLNMKKNNSAAKLEVENRRMEDRLRVLKEMMSAEKARREQDGGIYWQSGRSGPLKSRQPPNLTPSKQTQNGKSMKVKILSEKNGGKELSEQRSLPRCGQCERSSASLSCVECIENYCQVCFTKVHQKGALSRHHVKPILSNIRQITRKTVPKTEAPLSKTPPSVRPPGDCKPSLLDGKYDEDSSAKSFQLALAEWRSGTNGPSDHTSKALNSHTAKDSSTAVKFEASTMTGAGNLPVAQKKLSIEFSDANKVTYYERMLMRKYQDGTMERDSPRPNGLTDHSTPSEEATKEEEDVDEPLQSGISQYNIFYDIDVMPAEDIHTEGEEGSQCEPVLSSEDFGECKPPLRVSIEQVSFKELDEAPSQKASEQPPAKKLKQKESKHRNVSKEQSDKQLTASKEQVDKQLNASDQTQKPTVQRKSEKKKKTGGRTIQAVNPPVISEANPSEEVSSSKQQKLPDLTDSVKAAWKTCSQAGHAPQSLTHFFLNGVCPTVDKEEEAITPQPTDNINTSSTTEASGGGDDDTTSKFKLGSTIWLPQSSTVQQSDKSPSNHPTDAPSDAVNPPPVSRPATSLRRDPYYDDTDSDSEPENEREEFISSRLGMTREEFISSRLGMARDSVEWNEQAVTPATLRPDLEEKEEEEEREEEQDERERADCEALEELACELASTVECEGRLTRNEGTIESSDQQGGMELDYEGAAGTSSGGVEEGETDWMSVAGGMGEMMEPEMSKVMSEFELYQRDLMEADSD